MNFEPFFSVLNHPSLIETAYIVSRSLSHRLPKAKIQRQLANEIAVGDRASVETAVLAIVNEIERREGIQIETLTEGKRRHYSQALSAALNARIERETASISESEVNAAFKELEAIAI